MAENAPFFIDHEVITLNKNGVWLSDGIEITHEATCRLFARSLRHDDQGYFIQVQHEVKYIQVEDTAYFVTRIDGSAAAGFEVTLNDGKRELLQESTLSYRPGRLACGIERHGKLEEAKFLHAAYFDFLKNLEEDSKSYFITLRKQRIELAKKT